ncbi:MAG: hypothetical protein HKM98_08235, partial [Gammaproteobacteria bacterium]|nr:hypothetical protein [Gammaproteobacteria bacterium]
METGRMMMRPPKSLLASLLIDPSLQKLSTAFHETGRRIGGKPHRVIFYHRVADAWSWLLAQCLPQLISEYDIEIEVRLISALPIDAVSDPDRLDLYASYDAMRLARAWQLDFPDGAQSPAPALVRLAERVILEQPKNSVDMLIAATRAVWSADSRGLAALAQGHSPLSEQRAAAILSNNSRDLCRRGHFLGGMLWYQGEWFWGLDRLAFLEQRLRNYGINKSDKTINSQRFRPLERHLAGGSLPLDIEYFFSFRSPYAYIGAQRVTRLADRLGLNLVLRPVLPMVMRGTPVPTRKL